MTKDHQRLTVTAKRQQKLLQKVIKLRAIPAFHYHKKVRQIERERPKAAARHLMQSDIALTEVKISLKKIKKGSLQVSITSPMGCCKTYVIQH